MAKKYRLTPTLKLINWLMRLLIRLGLAPKRTHLLTVPGRKSGKLYSTPVSLVEEDGRRWLVSPYGEVAWLRNARAAGQVTLSRGSHSETVSFVEVKPAESAPVLKTYIQQEPITQPYFDIQPDAPLEAFEAEAAQHPVLRLQDSAEG